jgi:hypothetical protein
MRMSFTRLRAKRPDFLRKRKLVIFDYRTEKVK